MVVRRFDGPCRAQLGGRSSWHLGASCSDCRTGHISPRHAPRPVEPRRTAGTDVAAAASRSSLLVRRQMHVRQLTNHNKVSNEGFRASGSASGTPSPDGCLWTGATSPAVIGASPLEPVIPTEDQDQLPQTQLRMGPDASRDGARIWWGHGCTPQPGQDQRPVRLIRPRRGNDHAAQTVAAGTQPRANSANRLLQGEAARLRRCVAAHIPAAVRSWAAAGVPVPPSPRATAAEPWCFGPRCRPGSSA